MQESGRKAMRPAKGVILSGVQFRIKTVSGWYSGEAHFDMRAEGAKQNANLSGKRTENCFRRILTFEFDFPWDAPFFGASHYL